MNLNDHSVASSQLNVSNSIHVCELNKPLPSGNIDDSLLHINHIISESDPTLVHPMIKLILLRRSICVHQVSTLMIQMSS